VSFNDHRPCHGFVFGLLVAYPGGGEPGHGDFEVTLSRGRGGHGARDCFDS